MTFDFLFKSYDWKAIIGCPGRYVLKNGQKISLSELTGVNTKFKLYKSSKAKDFFYIITLNDGGIISYRKDNGDLIHTLSTTEGFKRKLKDLDLDFNELEEL